MRDNLRRYRAIRQALTQGYPGEPTGHMARHLTTLAGMISGIVGSKSSQLPTIATKIPDAATPESRVKRMTRLLQKEGIEEAVYFVPYGRHVTALFRLRDGGAGDGWQWSGRRL